IFTACDTETRACKSSTNTATNAPSCSRSCSDTQSFPNASRHENANNGAKTGFQCTTDGS
ncbi:hypothetical protein M427DRAFT_55344, partial [Gonapodya prolifera JEL478]